MNKKRSLPQSAKNFLKQWKNAFSSKGNVFPDDRDKKWTSKARDKKRIIFHSLTKYVESDDFYSARASVRKNRFHLGLLPQPFIGNLKTARIFILQTNPGFNHADYLEHKHSDFKNALIKNLQQKRQPYPFIFLNPQFCWHSGYQWWEKAFGTLFNNIEDPSEKRAHLKKCSYKIACLDLVPYHSKNAGFTGALMKLPSVEGMKDFVHQYLKPLAKKGDVLLIVARSQSTWGLKKGRNTIINPYPFASIRLDKAPFKKRILQFLQ